MYQIMTLTARLAAVAKCLEIANKTFLIVRANAVVESGMTQRKPLAVKECLMKDLMNAGVAAAMVLLMTQGNLI